MLGISSRSSNPVPESTMTDMVPRRALPSRHQLYLTENIRGATNSSKFAEEETYLCPSPWAAAVVQKPRDVSLHKADRLVQDLLAAQTSLDEEKRKVAERDAEIAQLHEKVAQLLDEAHELRQKSDTAETKAQQAQRISLLQPALDEDVNELRRLLSFHKTNGERMSRQCQDLQAMNKDLQVSLQATKKAVGEQAALISGLGLQPNRRSS